MTHSATPLHAIGTRIEELDALDAPGKQIGKTARSVIPQGTIKDALSGTWLGHSLHPVLTDVVIGTWTSAALLDLTGADDAAARRLIAVGAAAYPLTALTGVNDWADTEPKDAGVRRVGLVHAATNAVALTLQLGSLAARRRGNRGRGVALSLMGVGALTAASWLGGHLLDAQGVGVTQTVFDPGPADWTGVGVSEADLADGSPKTAVAGETPVLLVRHGGSVRALHDRCGHRGCSLAEGTFAVGMVECSCHGSRYALEDGRVLRGPATSPQPVLDVRETPGGLEVRRRQDR
jgi:nitrite reductase/ring-hydroxylating ferredoxin subunit/uncharacterized membrane protein